ncbi:LysR family transcriptional regulator [Ponticoccus sp. SC2-23]|uniref:LysR family transcriptional regulator n=1 Tax=Alexandriicola marinus TaxID=2081710 RepID=UPI000FD870E3|nr:LysR family transcriptional regulator [Alexandriicola marinus]MBM1218725.1 LysR family transcriptional regulator [Ponticoccus sp. SC6-9]MBM1224203.1 LysR family transcriptional regulator [Ponticoccus sp. SC6-15]MBM1230018.1 LysR family transcriptional regulator [Ponticoccus sp. SC6-38]MBM1233169.1 LysR family transcriptional regulator [Ponticoccus sp. SC6-45]MBM1236881.1 LysR family transcriptional regulator [Ponticoccus sp. SC6-49]MBM1242180.1 LysR family transcriptional regulator [Pontic
MSTINLHHLRLFRAVARDGTLTGAARSLRISQSAVSTQIKALELSLGHDLFERRGRNLVLTEAGRIALDHAEGIFRTAEDLSATLRSAGARRKALRIGALATLSRNFQIAFLRPLIGREDVEVILRSGPQESLLRGLDALSLDVVLTNLIPARDAASPYLVQRLDEQPVSLIGSPERQVAPGTPIEDILAAHPVVLPTPESSLRAGFDAMLDRLGVVPRIAAEADDMAMLRLLAREDAGVAVIPPIVVQDELASGKLVEFARLDEIKEVFCAVTIRRQFTNPLLSDVLSPESVAVDMSGLQEN